jgi:site-specific DNA recombinase
MRLVAYVRVSTEDQADFGVSLAAQREQVAAYAKAYNHQLVAVFEDAGISGSTLDRPGLKKALKLVRNAADGLLVTKLDRLSRSALDVLRLVDTRLHQKALVSVYEQIDASTPQGMVMLTMLAGFAQYERDMIRQRTRLALQHKKANGAVLGQVPLGYRRTAAGILEPDVNEAAVVARARQLAGEGRSLRRVAAALTAEGCRTKKGARWHAATIQKLLSRLRYVVDT